MARQQDRSAATRSALIAAARRSFIEQGFEATSTEAVLTVAQVSKGALYHHFASKTELLEAVFEEVTSEVVKTAQAAAVGVSSPRMALCAVLKAWLRAALAEEPRRILLQTGPAVLGVARARMIEEAITQAPLRRGLLRLVELEDAKCADTDLAARLLSAAIAEMALTAVDRDLDDPGLALLDAHIEVLVDALAPPGRPVADGSR